MELKTQVLPCSHDSGAKAIGAVARLCFLFNSEVEYWGYEKVVWLRVLLLSN
jgi:hypothetical protein